MEQNVEDYLESRWKHLTSQGVCDISFFSSGDVEAIEYIGRKSNDLKEFATAEAYYIRSSHLHLAKLTKISGFKPKPISNDIQASESLLVRNLAFYVIGGDKFDPHDQGIFQSILTQLCESTGMCPWNLKSSSFKEAIDLFLKFSKKETRDGYVKALSHVKIKNMHGYLNDKYTVLFFHALARIVDVCPAPHVTSAIHDHTFDKLIDDVTFAVEAMIPLLELDCTGLVADYIITRFHRCNCHDDFVEFNEALTVLFKEISSNLNEIFPRCCDVENKQDQVFISYCIQCCAHQIDKQYKIAKMTPSHFVRELCAQMLWPKIAIQTLLPTMLIREGVSLHHISLLLELCTHFTQLRLSVFIILAICYNKSGQRAPILRTLFDGVKITSTDHINTVAMKLDMLRTYDMFIFSRFSPLGVSNEFKAFHNILRKMSREDRKKITFDDVFEMIAELSISSSAFKRVHYIVDEIDKELSQQESVQTSYTPPQSEPMISTLPTQQPKPSPPQQPQQPQQPHQPLPRTFGGKKATAMKQGAPKEQPPPPPVNDALDFDFKFNDKDDDDDDDGGDDQQSTSSLSFGDGTESDASGYSIFNDR